MSKKCKQCERPLQKNENDLCPACKSSDDFEWKKWFQIAVGGVGILFAGLAAASQSKSK